MASLLECSDCNHKVSQTASRCPSCGKVFNAYTKGGMFAVANAKAQARGEKFEHGGCFGSTVLILGSLAFAIATLIGHAKAFF